MASSYFIVNSCRRDKPHAVSMNGVMIVSHHTSVEDAQCAIKQYVVEDEFTKYVKKIKKCLFWYGVLQGLPASTVKGIMRKEFEGAPCR